MPAARHSRATRRREDDPANKLAAPDSDADFRDQGQIGNLPGLPDLTGAPVPPEAWLSLQQSIGNSAVGNLMERRRAGQALPPGVRHEMEASFGQNFGQVQVHSGPEIDQAAETLEAGAFTVGGDIFVHSELGDFDTSVGRQVLGEELAHVAQGVGREGASRVTAPSETAERDAHRAGRAAAAGRPANVGAAPETAGAVARFGLKDVEEEAKKLMGIAGKAPGPETGSKAAEAGATAAAEQAAVKTGLSDEEKDRLQAGAVWPLMLLHAELVTKLADAPEGTPSREQLQPITDNSVSIPNFIYSFAGQPEIQATLEQAAVDVNSGRNAILAAIRPKDTLAATTEAIGAAGSEIGALAMAQPASAPAATGPATPGATEPAPAESLTAAEVEQLKSGAVDPLLHIAEELRGEKPDFGLIIGRMRGIPTLLRSFSKPAALVPQLHRKAMSVETQIRTLESVQAGANAALLEAMNSWQSAILTLMSLTSHPASGGGAAPAPATGAAAGNDDGQQKPN